MNKIKTVINKNCSMKTKKLIFIVFIFLFFDPIFACHCDTIQGFWNAKLSDQIMIKYTILCDEDVSGEWNISRYLEQNDFQDRERGRHYFFSR
jgi:hypothetical protein